MHSCVCSIPSEYITSNEAAAMAREKQDLDENYPMYGLVIDSDSFHFYRLDTLKGEVWSRSLFGV